MPLIQCNVYFKFVINICIGLSCELCVGTRLCSGHVSVKYAGESSVRKMIRV